MPTPRRPIRAPDPPAWWERLLIAGTLGLLGLVTGVVSVWMLTRIPGLDVGQWVYLLAGAVLGGVCFVAGLRAADGTMDVLGTIWHVVGQLSSAIFKVVWAVNRSR